MLSFRVGDKAVYPAHGVGQVLGIEEKKISGQDMNFYILKIIENGMTIMVPTTNVEKVGMRQLVGAKEIEKVYGILRKRDIAIDNQTWNRRYREYMEKIKTGSIYEIAEVMRDLHLLKDDKELSFGERKMLDMAKGLLVKEISIAKKTTEDKISEEIENVLMQRRPTKAATIAVASKDKGVTLKTGTSRKMGKPKRQRTTNKSLARAKAAKKDA